MNRLPIADTKFSEGTICESDVCKIQRECANHNTAGIYREETGLTPILYEQSSKIQCNGNTLSGQIGFVYREQSKWMVWGAVGDKKQDVTEAMICSAESQRIADDDADEDKPPTKVLIRRYNALSCPQVSLPFGEDKWVDMSVADVVNSLLKDNDVDIKIHRMTNSKRIIITIDNSSSAFKD